LDVRLADVTAKAAPSTTGCACRPELPHVRQLTTAPLCKGKYPCHEKRGCQVCATDESVPAQARATQHICTRTSVPAPLPAVQPFASWSRQNIAHECAAGSRRRSFARRAPQTAQMQHRKPRRGTTASCNGTGVRCGRTQCTDCSAVQSRQVGA
jgi:hypothetical protein